MVALLAGFFAFESPILGALRFFIVCAPYLSSEEERERESLNPSEEG